MGKGRSKRKSGRSRKLSRQGMKRQVKSRTKLRRTRNRKRGGAKMADKIAKFMKTPSEEEKMLIEEQGNLPDIPGHGQRQTDTIRLLDENITRNQSCPNLPPQTVFSPKRRYYPGEPRINEFLKPPVNSRPPTSSSALEEARARAETKEYKRDILRKLSKVSHIPSTSALRDDLQDMNVRSDLEQTICESPDEDSTGDDSAQLMKAMTGDGRDSPVAAAQARSRLEDEMELLDEDPMGCSRQWMQDSRTASAQQTRRSLEDAIYEPEGYQQPDEGRDSPVAESPLEKTICKRPHVEAEKALEYLKTLNYKPGMKIYSKEEINNWLLTNYGSTFHIDGKYRSNDLVFEQNDIDKLLLEQDILVYPTSIELGKVYYITLHSLEKYIDTMLFNLRSHGVLGAKKKSNPKSCKKKKKSCKKKKKRRSRTPKKSVAVNLMN